MGLPLLRGLGLLALRSRPTLCQGARAGGASACGPAAGPCKFSHGELSYSKVRAITGIARPEIEAELVEMARFATAPQLDRLVRGYRRAVSLESAEAAHRDRFLSCEWDEDGSLRIRGRLAPEDGALFLRAIEAGPRRDPRA